MTRKPWMDRLTSHRFTRDGTMTTDTARGWRDASDYLPASENEYARALGISVDEARERIARQKAAQIITEVQEPLL